MSFYVQRPINYDPNHIKQFGGWRCEMLDTSAIQSVKTLPNILSDYGIPTSRSLSGINGPHPNYEYRVIHMPEKLTVNILFRFKGWYDRLVSDLKAEWADRMTDYVYDSALGVRVSFEDRYVGLRE